MTVVVGRDADGVAANAAQVGLGRERDRLARGDRPRRHRRRRHRHPRRHARRDRDRRARGRQARALREAARQHRRRGRGDDRRRRPGGRARHPLHGGLHLPPRAGDDLRARPRRGRAHRRDPPGARGVPAGLARWTPMRRSPGACRRTTPARARSATSAPTPSTSPSTSPARSSRRVSGILETIVTERPLLGEGIGLSGTASTERGAVTVDDVALFTGRLDSGALASFEATRFRTGRKNALRIEISGSPGAISFDLERPQRARLLRRDRCPRPSWDSAGSSSPSTTIPTSRRGGRPVICSATSTASRTRSYDFVAAIAGGTQPLPSFADGLHVQRVLDAVERSSDAGSIWTPVGD